jgi:uncharacterized protein (DUF58 family)
MHDLLSPDTTARLARLTLLARRLSDAKKRGRRRTRRVGSGTETIDRRDYAGGDDVRRIDWSAYARFERLLVRVVADETPLRLALLIDTSSSMAYGGKLRQAARVAAGLAAVAIGGEDRVAIVKSAPAMTIARGAAGRLGSVKILGALDTLTAEGKTDLALAARQVRGALGGRGACVLISDLWDPRGSLHAARELRSYGHDVVLARVLTRFEREPEGLDGATLEDEETGELVDLPPGGADEAYREAFLAHQAELERGATELGASVLSIDAEEDFDEVILRALSSGVLRRSL